MASSQFSNPRLRKSRLNQVRITVLLSPHSSEGLYFYTRFHDNVSKLHKRVSEVVATGSRDRETVLRYIQCSVNTKYKYAQLPITVITLTGNGLHPQAPVLLQPLHDLRRRRSLRRNHSHLVNRCYHRNKLNRYQIRQLSKITFPSVDLPLLLWQ